jgi:hypothetical protein
LTTVLTSYGLSAEESAPIVAALRKRPEAWVGFMIRFELGIERPNPLRAVRSALTTAGAYIRQEWRKMVAGCRLSEVPSARPQSPRTHPKAARIVCAVKRDAIRRIASRTICATVSTPRSSFPTRGLAMPSEYFRQHGAVTFQEDPAGLMQVEPFNLVDNFMWANDYPHAEGTWPHSAGAIERQMGHLQDESRAKILGENMRKTFRFDRSKLLARRSQSSAVLH